MIERYKKLNAMTPYLYAEGSPIVFEAEVLYKDNVDEKIVAQIKMQNISKKIIVACKLQIQAFEIYGNKIESLDEVSYLDLRVEPGHSFGTKVPIELPNPLTRIIKVYVKQIVFADYTTWEGEMEDAEELGVSRIQDRYSDPEYIKQCWLEAGDDCKLIPKLSKGLFVCACGTINVGETSICQRCSRDYREVYSLLEPQSIEMKVSKRLAYERKIARRKRLIENTVRGVSIGAVVVTVISIFVINWAIPKYKYGKAEDYYNDGEYVKSIELLTEIDDFNNADELLVEVKYEYAKHLVENKSYKEALEIFEEINEDEKALSVLYEKYPQDNINRDIKETKYNLGLKYVDDEEYEKALEIFETISNYSDVGQKIKEIEYSAGLELLEKGEYKKAGEILIEKIGYPDSSEKHFECISGLYKEDRSLAEKYYDRLNSGQMSDMREYLLTNVKEGNSIPFGSYSGTIWWRVVEKKGETLLAIAEESVALWHYSSNSDNNNTWKDSEIRKWLNGKFMSNAFSATEKGKFITSTVNNGDEGDTEDKIFLLSVDEASSYFKNDEDRKIAPINGNGSWWLRTVGDDKKSICYVDDDGNVDSDGTLSYVQMNVIPAIRISSDEF